MTTPVTPRNFANAVQLGNINIQYQPTWDGAAWVVTPADVIVTGVGKLVFDGLVVQQVDIDLAATDLPAAGQTALNELLQYVEVELAAKYDIP